MSRFLLSAVSLLAFTTVACDNGSDQPNDDVREQTISFEAIDGAGAPFACGRTDAQLGNLDDVRPNDLRLYVHDVALLKGDKVVPLTLADDTSWQTANVAMLDFEDGTADCAHVIFGKTHTAETNTVVRGTPSEAGPYDGVRFTLGVPVELNHTDVGTAPSPLSSLGMDHGAADGRQFVRLAFYSDTTGATGNADHNLLMLRSVCNNVTKDGATPTSADDCDKPNRPVIELHREGGFDPATHRVVFDVNALVAGYSELGTAGPGDLNDAGRIDCFGPLHGGDLGPNSGALRCGSFYPSLGLDYETGTSTGTQTTFSIR